MVSVPLEKEITLVFWMYIWTHETNLQSAGKAGEKQWGAIKLWDLQGFFQEMQISKEQNPIHTLGNT